MKTIPLTPAQPSNFEADIDGRRYTFDFLYNSRLGLWHVSLSLGGVLLVPSTPAVLGVELFQGDANPDVPRGLYMAPSDSDTTDAGFEELGARIKFVYDDQGVLA